MSPSTLLLCFSAEEKDIASQLSGAARVGTDLWVGADEGTALWCLRPREDGALEPVTSLDLAKIFCLGRGEEVDIEGLDWDGRHLWIIGSHSLKRKKPDRDCKGSDGLSENLDDLADVNNQPSRYLLARIKLQVNGDGRSEAILDDLDRCEAPAQLLVREKGNALMRALRKDPHLARFARQDLVGEKGEREDILGLPGKDNGIDFEGIAVAETDGTGARLYLGMRGPVLRGWAVILEVEVKIGRKLNGNGLRKLKLQEIGADGTKYRKHFLQLNGHGVRDLCWDGDDLLVLAGPTMGIDSPLTVFRWHHARRSNEGGDQLVWSGSKALTLVPLATLPPEPDADRAETIASWKTKEGNDGILVLFDSPGPRHCEGDSVMGEIVALPRGHAAELESHFWSVALASASPLAMDAALQTALSELIHAGASAMASKKRKSGSDRQAATDALKGFLYEMKRVARESRQDSLTLSGFQSIREQMHRQAKSGWWPWFS